MGADVVFDGYYGMRNVGDDAFCVVAASVAAERWQARDIAFVARQSHLPLTPVPTRGVFPDPPRFRGHGRFAPLAVMLRARRVVHVGGSTFMKPLTHHSDEVRLAHLKLLDLHAVGVSVGPFRNSSDARTVARTLGAFRSISLRDSASLERLLDLGVRTPATVGFDVATLLPEVTGAGRVRTPRGERVRPTLGVVLCAHKPRPGEDVDTDERRYERTATAVGQTVRTTGAAVRILVFNDHPLWGDLALSRRLEEELKVLTDEVELVVRDRDVGTMLDAVASCDAVVATRLHAAVFAYACGVPFAVIAYQEKGRDFANEVGLPAQLVHPADGPHPADAVHAWSRLLAGPDDLLPSLDLDVALKRAASSFPDAI